MTRVRPTVREIKRLQALVNSFEAANIERQGIIDNFNAQRAKDAEGTQKLKQRIRELEDKLDSYERVPEGDEITDFGLVSEDLLTSFALATLQGNEDLADDLREECEKAATFSPHSQQQILIDEHGVRRFRRNALVRKLVDECSGNGQIGLNYLATVDAPREDHAQLAQLIGYSVDGYQSLSYALPVKDDE